MSADRSAGRTGTGTVGLQWSHVDAVVGEAAGEPAGALLVTADRSAGRTGTGTVGLQWSRVDAVIGGAAGEPAGARSSDVAVAVAVAERNVRGAFGHFAVPGRRRRPSDRHPHPSDCYVREETGKPAQSIRGVRPRPGSVEFCLSCVVSVWFCH